MHEDGIRKELRGPLWNMIIDETTSDGLAPHGEGMARLIHRI